MIAAARAAILTSILMISAVGAADGPRQTVGPAAADTAADGSQRPPRERATAAATPDLSGRARTGNASLYSRKFTGPKMADGNRIDPHAANAASKTLRLGTTAKVTNLETGLSAEITIQDRGPYVKARIVGLSPSTAREIGVDRRSGVAKVVIAPIAVPLPGDAVRHGAAAGDKGGHRRPPSGTNR
jgi:rare lipoprotein A